ncbi:MAG: hypothetical protein K2F56_02965, partial [Anaeroplasmataceae bacterium]|nr:hypothetical protein [Anaeroplasmataceae bacterium]
AVFMIGVIAVSLMTYSLIYDNLQTAWPLYLGVSIFGIFFIVGFVGIVVLLRKYLILKSVLKHGTNTIGTYEDTGRTIGWGTGGGRTSNGFSAFYNQIIFSYKVNGEKREYKSCTVYLESEVIKLLKMRTFAIKCKGKHAIICEGL